jgi:hypothetical protein
MPIRLRLGHAVPLPTVAPARLRSAPLGAQTGGSIARQRLDQAFGHYRVISQPLTRRVALRATYRTASGTSTNPSNAAGLERARAPARLGRCRCSRMAGSRSGSWQSPPRPQAPVSRGSSDAGVWTEARRRLEKPNRAAENSPAETAGPLWLIHSRVDERTRSASKVTPRHVNGSIRLNRRETRRRRSSEWHGVHHRAGGHVPQGRHRDPHLKGTLTAPGRRRYTAKKSRSSGTR